jgi:hypothetical protein
MANDYISLLQLLLEYISRSMSVIPVSTTVHRFLCLIEAFFHVFEEFIQVYLLALLNIWLYFRYVHKSSPFWRSQYLLYSVHILVYGFPIICVFIESHFGFIETVDQLGASCYTSFPSLIVLLLNNIIGLIVPIVLSICFISIDIYYVKNSQNTFKSIRRLHYHLITQCSILYTVWFLFFIPKVIIFPAMTPSIQQRISVKILSVVDIISDVLIITMVDRRFVNLWKNLYYRLREKI